MTNLGRKSAENTRQAELQKKSVVLVLELLIELIVEFQSRVMEQEQSVPLLSTMINKLKVLQSLIKDLVILLVILTL